MEYYDKWLETNYIDELSQKQKRHDDYMEYLAEQADLKCSEVEGKDYE